MGTLRKMGAFLGLVPDEADRYAARGERDDAYADDTDTDYDPRYAGRYEDDSYTGHDTEDSDRPGYGTDGYLRDDYSVDASDHTGGSGSGSYGDHPADTYEADTSDHGGRELEYAGRYTETPAADHADYSPYAGADRTRPTEPRAQSSLGSRRSGKSGRGAARGNDDVDYSTQGALAVQPQAVEVALADPANAKPSTVSLTGFADAREVGELYRTGQAVILDMTELTDAEARRMVDFAAGLAFAVRGSIDKVTTKVFMLHQPDGDNDRSGR